MDYDIMIQIAGLCLFGILLVVGCLFAFHSGDQPIQEVFCPVCQRFTENFSKFEVRIPYCERCGSWQTLRSR
jgi:hypothetical protein